jgi:hypothetical protein
MAAERIRIVSTWFAGAFVSVLLGLASTSLPGLF